MPTPEIERALADGAARSRAATGLPDTATGLPATATGRDRAEVYRAHGAWLEVRLRDLWKRRKWWVIWAGLFLLLDIVAGLAAAGANGHF